MTFIQPELLILFPIFLVLMLELMGNEKQLYSDNSGLKRTFEAFCTGQGQQANGMRRAADDMLNNLRLYGQEESKGIYRGANAGAKYRNHSYRRRCRSAVEASSQNSKTTFCLRVTGKLSVCAKHLNWYKDP